MSILQLHEQADCARFPGSNNIEANLNRQEKVMACGTASPVHALVWSKWQMEQKTNIARRADGQRMAPGWD
jgi:hypothetical protein